jgi:phosphatidylglycerol---prolipoprotein diacylglyceryl transferase
LYSVLFQIGSISIFSYGLITAIGFLIGVYYFVKLAIKHKAHLEFISDHFFILIISALIGARLAYAYAFWEIYSGNILTVFYFWEASYLLWGGVIGFLVVFGSYCWKQKEDIDSWLDILIPAFTVSLIFESVAKFLDGSAYGKPTEFPLGVTFETTTVPYTIPIHPTQLYLAGILIILLLFIYPWLKKKYPGREGVVGWGGLTMLSISSFVIEFFRGDEMEMILGLRWTQVLEFLVIAFSMAFLYKIFTNNPLEEEQIS